MAQAPTLPAPKSHPRGFIVPFTPVPGHGAPLVKVWINGQVEATFVVDTGTNNCLISQSLVKKLRLTPHAALLADGKPLLFSGKQPLAVTLTSLKIGGQTGLLNIQPILAPILVQTDEQLRVSGNRLADGLIGSNLLDEFAVSLDFPAHTITLLYPGSLTTEEAQHLGYSQAGGTSVLLSESANRFYSVQAGLENNSVLRQVDLLLDTGSQLTAIPHYTAQELSLAPLRRISQAGLAGSFGVYEARLQTFELGGLRLTGTQVTYSSDTSDHIPRLGLDILSGYRMLMDFPAKKMYLQPAVPTVKIGLPQGGPAPVNKMPGL